MWQERADYGHFFYRIPNGESAADAYDRISGFNESLWRSFGEEDFASVCVLVTHGLMTRVFLMKWYHFSVEYFEDLRNVNHCEFVVMKLNPDNGKFILQNQLRTWSQLRREEEAEAVAAPASPIPVRKRWRDCQDSCDASGFERRQQQRRQNTAELFLDEATLVSIQQSDRTQSSKLPPPPLPPPAANSGQDDHRGRTDTSSETPQPENTKDIAGAPAPSSRKRFLSPTTQAILYAGRDGGGSQSGAASEDDDDENNNNESSSPSYLHAYSKTNDPSAPPSGPTTHPKDNPHTGRTNPATGNPKKDPHIRSIALALRVRSQGQGQGQGQGQRQTGFPDGALATESGGMGSPKRARADALGDQSDVDDDDDHDEA